MLLYRLGNWVLYFGEAARLGQSRWSRCDAPIPQLLDLHNRLMNLLEQGARMRDAKTSRTRRTLTA